MEKKVGGSSYHATDGMILYCNSVIGTVRRTVDIPDGGNTWYMKRHNPQSSPQPKQTTGTETRRVTTTIMIAYNYYYYYYYYSLYAIYTVPYW